MASPLPLPMQASPFSASVVTLVAEKWLVVAGASSLLPSIHAKVARAAAAKPCGSSVYILCKLFCGCAMP